MTHETHEMNILSKFQLPRFGSEGVMKIFSQRITESVNYLINNKGVCRTALATSGLLNMFIRGYKLMVSCANLMTIILKIL